MSSHTKNRLTDEVDALFRVRLAEFISLRKSIATRLKKDGQADEAERVQGLAKPSISAWTVNQLYWTHREAFDRLIATGQRFRRAQTSRQSARVADMREALDARREVLSELSDLATILLRDTGHNPSLDTIRRITTTLEALSAYETLPDGLTPGRLTHDVDPPGFESLGGFTPGTRSTTRTEEPAHVSLPKKSAGPPAKTRQKSPAGEVSRVEEGRRQAGIVAAKASLQAAKKSLNEARTRTQNLESTLKKADAVAKEAEKHRRELEERLKKATLASEEASRRAEGVTAELQLMTKAVEEAKRSVDDSTRELESLFREPPGR